MSVASWLRKRYRFTNTFHACKRNAVHTSASKEQTLTNTFELFHCKQRKKSVKQGPSNYRAYCRERLAWSLGRWTDRQAQPFSRPGRTDGRLCSEMNRASSMGNFSSKINAEIAVPPAPRWLFDYITVTSHVAGSFCRWLVAYTDLE